ncbi:MAG: DUF4433 domain-containing protein [Parvibaculum sp.]
MTVPNHPKIYHIVHVDKLASIVGEGLLSDSDMEQRTDLGTTIGMSSIKRRRREDLQLSCHPGLFVGECVPFYFCPRSIMLYLIHRANHAELAYRGGQTPILHLECDLRSAVQWAEANRKRWAFSLSNAGSYYCEHRTNLAHLGELDWESIATTRWSGPGISGQVKEGKQAEFLIENSFPWHLVERIGMYSDNYAPQIARAMRGANHRPPVEVRRDWYY